MARKKVYRFPDIKFTNLLVDCDEGYTEMNGGVVVFGR